MPHLLHWLAATIIDIKWKNEQSRQTLLEQIAAHGNGNEASMLIEWNISNLILPPCRDTGRSTQVRFNLDDHILTTHYPKRIVQQQKEHPQQALLTQH